MFKVNMGGWDRGLRGILGVALIAGYLMNSGGAYSWLYLAAAAIMLVTAAMSRCPLYSIFGIRTCRVSKS